MQRALDAEATSFPRKAMSPHTPGQLCQPWPRASLREEQWVAGMKVTCAKWRPARCPASHLPQTLGTSLPLPGAPVRAAKASPESLPTPTTPPPGPGEETASAPASPGPGAFVRHSETLPAPTPTFRATHLRRTGLGPTPGETEGREARAPQKQAAPPPPYPCRLWEKFQAALQRAARRIAAKSTTEVPAGPRGMRAGSPPPPAGTFSFFAVPKLPQGRKRRPRRRPAAAAALHAQRRLLLLVKSYFARGGTGAEPGVTSPRGLRELLRNAGSGAAPPPPAGETRASRGRAPRASRRLCSPPAAARGSGRERGPAPLAVLLQKWESEMRVFGEPCSGTAEDGRGESPNAGSEAPWAWVPGRRSRRSGCR